MTHSIDPKVDDETIVKALKEYYSYYDNLPRELRDVLKIYPNCLGAAVQLNAAFASKDYAAAYLMEICIQKWGDRRI